MMSTGIASGSTFHRRALISQLRGMVQHAKSKVKIKIKIKKDFDRLAHG
jgi:hypothetical protein